MPTTLELRDGARLYRRAAQQETTPLLSEMLSSHARALSQLAEEIDRKCVMRIWR